MTSAFRKFVIINPSELERLKEKRIRDYDQNLTALARVEASIESMLADTSISDEEKLKLYGSLSSKFENIHSKCNKSTLQSSKTASVPLVLPNKLNVEPIIQLPLREIVEEPILPPAQLEELEILPIAKAEDLLPQDVKGIDIDNLLLKIPSQYHQKFKSLMESLKNFPGLISSSPNDFLIISGKVIPDTSLTDLFRDLYVPSSNHCNIGQTQFLKALVTCNIKSNLISNSHLRTSYLKLLNQPLNIQVGKGPPPGKRPCILMLYKS